VFFSFQPPGPITLSLLVVLKSLVCAHTQTYIYSEAAFVSPCTGVWALVLVVIAVGGGLFIAGNGAPDVQVSID
jgi:hypothetical protein